MIATAKTKTAERKRIENLKNDSNYYASLVRTRIPFSTRESTYNISVQARRLQDLLIRDPQNHRHPPEEAIRELGKL